MRIKFNILPIFRRKFQHVLVTVKEVVVCFLPPSFIMPQLLVGFSFFFWIGFLLKNIDSNNGKQGSQSISNKWMKTFNRRWWWSRDFANFCRLFVGLVSFLLLLIYFFFYQNTTCQMKWNNSICLMVGDYLYILLLKIVFDGLRWGWRAIENLLEIDICIFKL